MDERISNNEAVAAVDTIIAVVEMVLTAAVLTDLTEYPRSLFSMSLSNFSVPENATLKPDRPSRTRTRAAAAIVISMLVGTAAVADRPVQPTSQIQTAHQAWSTFLGDGLIGNDLIGNDLMGDPSGDDRSGHATLATFLLQQPPSDDADPTPIDRLDMSDLEALEKRLQLDSLDQIGPDLEAMERRLDLQQEPGIDPTEPSERPESSDSQSTTDRSSGPPERAVPSIVDGRFVMPPLSVATLDTDTVGNGRRPETFRSARQTPRMPLPESALDRSILWNPMLRTWAASGNFSNPLYFEDRMLERHGQSRWGYLQPLASGVRFFSTAALLPYLASIQPPCQCRYTLGYYRSGLCTPAFVQRPPWDREALTAQSISTAAGLWIFP